MTQSLLSFLFGGKACRKAWCCTWKRDYWLSHTPTSRNVLAHSWIFFCCSGTCNYVILRVECARSVHVYYSVLCLLINVFLLIFLHRTLPLLLPSCNKSHIVAVFMSTPRGVCLRLDSKPGAAVLLPFCGPFLKVSGLS